MAQPIIPILQDIPISGLSELQAHITELSRDPTIPFNEKLFDDVELQLTEETIPLLQSLLPPLSTILHTSPQNPTPALTLTTKLLSPLPLSAILSLSPPESLILGLRSPLPGAALLSLAALHKAASTPHDAALLSTLPDVVSTLITVWLESEHVGVSEKAGRVLGDALECDFKADRLAGVILNGNGGISHAGNPRLWRLILQDFENLGIITSLCTPSLDRTTHQTTLSQGRLLRLLPRLSSLSLSSITQTPHTGLFPMPNAEGAPSAGLLQWAALSMVDKSDTLMHLNLVDFFETFVSVMRVSKNRSAETDEEVGALVKSAVREDAELETALRGLPGRTVEEESEILREYIDQILS